MDYTFLAFLSVILLLTQFMGKVSKRVQLPAVVGALTAGVLLGPSVFDWVKLDGTSGGFVTMAAEIGVTLLMFTAGLETDLKELKNNLFSSLIVAAFGVIVPLLGGFLSYSMYFREGLTQYQTVLKSVFMGVVLTATSVSITVETLREMGKANGKVATTILGAAVIDDILGVIVLSVMTSLKEPSAKISAVAFNIFCFLGSVALIWMAAAALRKRGRLQKMDRTAVVCSLALCFLVAWMAEGIYQIADVTGAYFAGLILSQSKNTRYIEEQCKVPLELFFAPIFFASVGLQVSLKEMDGAMWGFSVIFLVVAVLTKITGCGLGAKLTGGSIKESLQIGIGMMARGEVALIMAQKGMETGLLPEQLFAPVVLVVLATTLAAPILLSVVMRGGNKRISTG